MSRKHGMAGIKGSWARAGGDKQTGDVWDSRTDENGETVHQKFARKMMERRNKERVREPLPPIKIRPMTIDDAAYVLDSWANSYRRSPSTGPIDREVFNIEQRARINRLVTRPTARVFIACDEAEPRTIRGWICFEAPAEEGDGIPIVHYVCVQPAHQLQGIGTGLINVARTTAKDAARIMWTTHETLPMRHCREKWNLLFNPYLLELPSRQATVKTKDLAT